MFTGEVDVGILDRAAVNIGGTDACPVCSQSKENGDDVAVKGRSVVRPWAVGTKEGAAAIDAHGDAGRGKHEEQERRDGGDEHGDEN